MVESLEIKQSRKYTISLQILGWSLMLIFAFHASTHMVGAGDTWVALACGRHFINHGVDTVEPFSANSHKAGPTQEDIDNWPGAAGWLAKTVGLETVKYWHPTGWVNQNWLTHVIFYWLSHLSPLADAESDSFNTLVYWKFAIYIITIICIYYTARVLGAGHILSAIFACFALFIGRSFLDIRPAGFSNFLTAVFLLILILATYRNILYIWLIVPISVFWCNVHGGYIYIFIILVPFVGLHFLTSFSKNRFISIGKRGLYHTIAVGIVTFLAVIIFNPFHLTNLTHTFIISFSKHAEMWRTVNEWHPAFEWGNPVGTSYPFLVMFVMGIGLIIFSPISRTLKPRLLKGPPKQLGMQQKQYTTLSRVLGYAAAIFLFWATLIAFSFADLKPADFFICFCFAVILLLSVYNNVHFIYLIVLLTILALGTASPEKAYAGKYIYPFLILPGYVILHTVASLLSDKLVLRKKDIIFVSGVAFAAFVVMLVFFNPLQTAEGVTVSSFFQLQKVWRPNYTNNAVPNYSNILVVLYAVNLLSIIIGLTLPKLRASYLTPTKPENNSSTESYTLPKIDLAIIVVVVLTVYMAIRSRRFIPIAAIAACPLMASLTEQLIRVISASRNFYKHKRLVVSPVPRRLQQGFVYAGITAVLVFGIFWGLKFKRVYLDFWPTDEHFNSVFMRMTASNVKPFHAMRFIKDNKLNGKMFNYWTEGGFIAWGQEPDPNTGKTPLQLFMDGRAQAAYEPMAYHVWSGIMLGGPIGRQIMETSRLKGRKLTSDEYRRMGKEIGNKLQELKVWVILMPINAKNATFLSSIEANKEWFPVFVNNKQKMFVDRTTQKGRELVNGIMSDQTIYPNEFSKYLVQAHTLLFFVEGKEAKYKGLDLAMKAFEIFPSQASIREVMTALGFKELAPRVKSLLEDYVDEFLENRNQWAKENGYHHKVVTAMIASNYLGRLSQAQKDFKAVQFYGSTRDFCNNERKRIERKKRW